jgi:hypothetical protein
MRSLALDVHQSFCEVAICEQGKVRSAGRVKSERSALELFSESLDPTDQVVMEATGPAMEIARIIEPHVARVVAPTPRTYGRSPARVKSDRFDAHAWPACSTPQHAGGRLGAEEATPGTPPGREEGGWVRPAHQGQEP